VASQTAADLAVANTTGANRILIRIGWAGIALHAIHRGLRVGADEVTEGKSWLDASVELDPRIAIEIMFLTAATMQAFFIPFNRGIDALDGIVLVGLHATYIAITPKGEVGESLHVGVPGYLQDRPRPRRLTAVVALLAFSAFVLLIAVQPSLRGWRPTGPCSASPRSS